MAASKPTCSACCTAASNSDGGLCSCEAWKPMTVTRAPLDRVETRPTSGGRQGRCGAARTRLGARPPTDVRVSTHFRAHKPSKSVKSAHFRGLARQDGTVSDDATAPRSEEHTSELQSREKLVCRLLLAKKK